MTIKEKIQQVDKKEKGSGTFSRMQIYEIHHLYHASEYEGGEKVAEALLRDRLTA